MRLALICAALVFVQAAQAESSVGSAVGAGSASVGSLSGSVKSSTSSTDGGKRAEGRYRVVEVAEAGPGQTALRLAPEAAGREALTLTLPQAAARGVQAGTVVQATPRPYGVEFAEAQTRRAFFLALDEGWQGELAARPVTL